jgi:DMSO reductase anchor subunit
VVTKCDLCQPRLAAGGSPACVEACPTRAITLEKVDVAQWRADHHQGDAPGLPSADVTLSTTRIVIPPDLPPTTRSVVEDRVEPADAHWPLVAVTVLTQVSLGTLVGTVALRALMAPRTAVAGAATAAAAGAVALAVSVLHLGRPAVAWKALRNLRRSWLSREVALFGAFSAATFGYAGASLLGVGASGAMVALGATAVTLGAAGVYASGRLYLVPARPVWNSWRTVVAFFATTLATGPPLAALAVGPTTGGARLMFALAGLGSLAQIGAVQHLVASIAARREREFALTARLLFGRFRLLFALRAGAALAGAALCVWAAVGVGGPGARPVAVAVLVVAGGGELIGRYLFFVTVTPMTAARRFSAGSR